MSPSFVLRRVLGEEGKNVGGHLGVRPSPGLRSVSGWSQDIDDYNLVCV